MSLSSTPRDRILATYSELSPKQRQLARFFLDNEDVVAFASANDISEQVNASAATVVRFCRALGYEGYPDLQSAIRAQFSQYRTAVQKLSERLANGGFSDNLPSQITVANGQSIQETMQLVSKEKLTGAVSAIVEADQIRIFGSGLSAAAAVSAEYALTTLGFPARACLNGGVSQTLEVAHLTDRDLVIVVSIWRYLRHEVEASKAARAAGATCLAITDSAVSPVATLADHVFIAATEGATHSRSLAGILSVIDLLSAAIAAERPEESMKALKRIDTLYREQGMLLGE